MRFLASGVLIVKDAFVLWSDLMVGEMMIWLHVITGVGFALDDLVHGHFQDAGMA